mmetsp:Transcript_2552/g.5724  ORF Transcript_2552/g.5724 Transcript_2552/m.5724 type:complete len:296 (-) Transcript_2552:290-1177(-)
MSTIFNPCFVENSWSCGRRLMLPSWSLTISHSTPAGPHPARRARSSAASVCPTRFSTPPSRYRSGNTCPGRTNSSALALGSPSLATVAARSPAEMPVTDVTRSHVTVNAVFIASSFSLELTISGSLSLSAHSFSTETHTTPDVYRIMNAMDSAVILSAAPMRSPSFSRSSSSSTTTNLPAATSLSASSMEAKPGVGVSGSIVVGSASGCQLGVAAKRVEVVEERTSWLVTIKPPWVRFAPPPGAIALLTPPRRAELELPPHPLLLLLLLLPPLRRAAIPPAGTAQHRIAVAAARF